MQGGRLQNNQDDGLGADEGGVGTWGVGFFTSGNRPAEGGKVLVSLCTARTYQSL